MPEKFRLGKYWLDNVHGSSKFYRFWYDAGTGDVSRRSLKTAVFEEAKIRLAAIVLAEGEAAPRDPGEVNLVTILNRYWTEHSDHRPNPYAARRAGNLLLDSMGSAARVSVLTKTKQHEFIFSLSNRGLSVAYISRIQTIIAAALKRAFNNEDGMLTRIPKIIVRVSEIAELLNAPEPEPDNWHPTMQQIAAFMDACDNQSVLRMAVLTLAFAGRPEAVEEATSDQFDAELGTIAWNQEGRRQTKKYRPTVPVPARLLDYIGSIEGMFVPSLTREMWNATCKRAGGPHFPPRRLRHFTATEMRKRDVPKEQREMWMGHRRRDINDSYGHFHPDYLKAARDCADAVLGELEALCTLSIYRQIADKPALVRYEKTQAASHKSRRGIDPLDTLLCYPSKKESA